MKQALVVGGDSSIGCSLVECFRSKGCAVMQTSRRTRGNSAEGSFYLDLGSWERSPVLEVDNCDVFFCAGITNTATCREDPRGSRCINVDATIGLMKALLENGCRIAFLSTNQVFDGLDAFPVPSESRSPQTEYGRQKAEVEQWLVQECSNAVVIRLGKVLTPGMGLFDDWLHKLRSGQQVQAFSNWLLSPVSLRSLGPIIAGCMDPTLSRQWFHFSGKGECSYEDAARCLVDVLGCDQKLVVGTRLEESAFTPEWSPEHVALNCDWEEEHLGWIYPKPLDVLGEYFNTLIRDT